jgi:hypothetical protein
MKRILLISIAYFVNLTFLNGQIEYVDQRLYKDAEYGYTMYQKDTIYWTEFTYYKKPIQLDKLKDLAFKEEHLLTPNSLIQSFALCNSDQWYRKIQTSFNQKKYTKSDKRDNYILSKEYQQKFILQILCEYKFVYQKTDYQIVLINYHNQDGYTINKVILIEKGNDYKWRLSNNYLLDDISNYFYLKPQLLFKHFLGVESAYEQKNKEVVEILVDEISTQKIKKYVYKKVVYPYQQFFINSYFKSENDKNISEVNLCIPLTALPDMSFLEEDLKLRSNKYNESSLFFYDNRVFISERKFSDVNLFKYADDSINLKQDFGTIYKMKHSKHLNRYDTIPEIALASWIFSNSLEDKRKHSIGFETVGGRAQRYIDEGSSRNWIEWQHKLEFVVGNDIQYVYIQFSEWYGKLDDPKDESGWRYNFIGDKSILMRKENNEWKMVFDCKNEMMQLVQAFDLMNYEAIKLILKGESIGMKEFDCYINGGLISNKEDGRIYYNDIWMIKMPSYHWDYSIPNRFRTRFKINDIFDILGDDNSTKVQYKVIK